MPKSFDAANPPFDRLTTREVETLREAIDIGYYRPDEQIVAQGAEAEFLFVVIKGAVEERDGEELIALLGPKDSFDSRFLGPVEPGQLRGRVWRIVWPRSRWGSVP